MPGQQALVADEMSRLTGPQLVRGIAQDTIAMAINDLITVGATLVVQAYRLPAAATVSPTATRAQALVEGRKAAR